MTTRDQAIRLATDVLVDTHRLAPGAQAQAVVDTLIDNGLIPDREPRGPRSSDEPRPEVLAAS